MEKPALEKYGLTQKDVEYYLKQKELFDKEYEKHLLINEIISFFIIWIISTVIVLIIMMLVDSSIFEEKWMIWVTPFSALGFPTPLFFVISGGPYQFLDRKNEIKIKYFSTTLEEKYIKYTESLKKYNRYLEQNNRNYWIQMTGLQFEKEVASLFRAKGYDATITSATADGGVDIILNKDGERIAVQCKHHAKPIGPNDVRALQGVVASQNYSKGIFVSLNGYTSTVYYEVRNGNVKIDLLDLKDILKMAKKDPYEPFDNPEKPFEKKEMQREPVLGEIVIHKIFGDGKIIKINPKENGEKYLTVDFTHSIKDFVFPSAFLMGFLMFQEDVDASK